MFDHILILDTETASIEQGVVEVAYFEVDSDFNLISKHRSLIDPECPIDPRASGVHGLEYDDVKDAPTLSEYFGDQFKDKHVLMVGHNIQFDIRHTETVFGEVTPLCTLRLARLQYPEAPDHKLQTLMYYLNLTKAGNHNALDDVNTCYDLIRKVMQEADVSFMDIVKELYNPIMYEFMPFGKHRGTPMKDVPRSWLKWLSAQPDVDTDMLYTMEQLGIIKR